MSEPVGASCVERDIEQLHSEFLAILPRIETHAKIYFRYLSCPGKRADAVQETIAVAWKWFLRITEQGKDVNEFVATLATFAARHVRSGRHLCGQEKSKDVMSPLAQKRHGIHVEHLDCSTRRDHETFFGDPQGQQHMDAYEERLKDNSQTPVVEQVIFRVDFREWLVQLGPRNREIAKDMALDHATKDLADKHKISAGRISQMRREFHLNWQRFHGEEA